MSSWATQVQYSVYRDQYEFGPESHCSRNTSSYGVRFVHGRGLDSYSPSAAQTAKSSLTTPCTCIISHSRFHVWNPRAESDVRALNCTMGSV